VLATENAEGNPMAVSASETDPGSVRIHPMPPEGFDPRAASPLELRRYGLPQRPDPAARPELAALWDETFSRDLTYISPVLQPAQDLLPGIGRPDRLRQDVTLPHPYWSGGVVHAPVGQPLGWVTGRWNVPDVAPPADGPGNWYSFAWIGIDGTADVTQIGTVQSVSANPDGTLSKQCYAVCEWWPLLWKVVTNFPVSFGDTVSGLICMLSLTEAEYSMVNLTAGLYTGFRILTPPGGTVSAENQAEWILEHPGVKGASAQLPNFGEIYFDSALAGYGLEFVADAGPDTILNMVENDITVATTTVETPTLIRIAYTGG
jgi:Peptidase A4 family